MSTKRCVSCIPYFFPTFCIVSHRSFFPFSRFIWPSAFQMYVKYCIVKYFLACSVKNNLASFNVVKELFTKGDLFTERNNSIYRDQVLCCEKNQKKGNRYTNILLVPKMRNYRHYQTFSELTLCAINFRRRVLQISVPITFLLQFSSRCCQWDWWQEEGFLEKTLIRD